MIYYSHVNEDNRIERKLLGVSSCSSVVAIAGSGERVISLLDHEPSTRFEVVDVNEDALFLLQLKLAALKNLTVEDYWQFIGHHDADRKARKEWYAGLRKQLSGPCMQYWDAHQEAIEKGILDMGHFETFLKRVRPFLLFFLGPYMVSLCSGSSPQSFKFPKRRWNLVMWLFSKRWVYRLWGNRDIAFISKDASILQIPVSLKKIVSGGEAASCFMSHLIFKGHLRDMHEQDLPPSLQQETLERIKQRIMSSKINIHYHHRDAASFIEMDLHRQASGVFYSLSDILSFETPAYLDRILKQAAIKGNVVVWRSFLRHRLSEESLGSMTKTYGLLQDHSDQESTRMYQVFALGEKGINA